MKELIESTKRLQGDIDRCISRLVNARQYHDKIDEAVAVLDMERLLVSSTQQLQCCIDKLQECGSVVEWQTGEPQKEGWYLATCKNGEPESFVALVYCDGSKWNANLGRNLRKEVIIESWVKISSIEPCEFNKI